MLIDRCDGRDTETSRFFFSAAIRLIAGNARNGQQGEPRRGARRLLGGRSPARFSREAKICIRELSSHRDSRIDRFIVLMANTCLICAPHRSPLVPSFLFFIPLFLFFHSRSLFRPFTVALPCPVTMIDRLCQDRAASDAHARFPGWRNDESGVLN